MTRIAVSRDKGGLLGAADTSCRANARRVSNQGRCKREKNVDSAGNSPLAPSHDRFDVVQEFVSAAADVDLMADLRELIGDASRELGFEYFAIVHHIRFGRPSSDKVRLSNYPLEWLALLRQNEHFDEPVLKAAERACNGFRWNQLPELIELTEAQEQYMDRAVHHGLAEGFTVPNHVPGEIFGSCHFAVSSRTALPQQSLPAAQALGCFAFEAARRLLETRREPSDSYVIPAPLTERQRDCLLFAAKGKSDSVIAELLNIRPRTVNEHIEAAKRRYSVATRTQLIVRALFRSEICFSEIID
jgi:LuxR family quorum-sensing system transcriptional regulator CciR